MRKLILFGIALLVMVMACSQQDGKPELAEGEILFNVDSTLTQTPFTAPGFGFEVRPPVGWEATPAEALQAVESSVVQAKSDFQVRPLQFFLHPENQALLAVSHVIGPDGTRESDSIKEGYITAVRTTFALDNLQENRYLKTGIPIVQYLMQKDGNIVFKLLFEEANHQLIQLDYTVPREVYAGEIKAIESSIGSIRILGEEV